MESKVQDMETKQETMEKKISNDVPGMMTTTGKSAGDSSWQEYVDLVVDFLAKVPEQLGSFFSDYQKPLTTTGLIVASAITVYITLSVLDAIDNIPLLSSILELVGLGYSVWFVTRYLLKASTRQELFSEFDSLKQQVLGGKADN
ncbi:CAAD domain-containing protein [Cyanobacterium aponinum UTEX 3222]|uniref:Cyanobacterial aminoacyl-tRNA synthetase CAAD domain-containing protein n=3 Tax=Cyanobacterium aponinum TaxID=379064 RepID=K9Z1C6_CYAAP|nr:MULTISPECIES: CAAD domain-containing protein [Cyanobacterium]WRL40462.1 CAAD domain-containing protein [Cyanobacterium aponinum UTEX 3222]AFZ52532.1 hypothetical protein Cyan10605_0388 [Cyanobacterium aponinum PCC 10605]MBD2393167.1 CAAD domain-containing protein [Cyanobacterium aponinum FACHB-4101]MTF37465.1 hypothetical protein [Cyanobacterium aponinum 0216]PHV62354.1 hypothetical protein CSQ80_10910 [Cyanobacterium aponinum IPPAS B-1201]